MRIGIFARTFAGRDLDEVLDAVVGHGIAVVQFNLSCAGLESLPESLEANVCTQIRAAHESRQLEMAAVSGTYNMIDPDRARRDAMTKRAIELIRTARKLGSGIVTLCTGSCDRHDMWRAHADNKSVESWIALIQTLERLLPVAQANGVNLGIEPEPGNVISTARKARQLLDEVRSPHLRIILDGANLWGAVDSRRMVETMDEAFELLGPDIVLIHAKEVPITPAVKLEAVGAGRINWNAYLDGIQSIHFDGPIIIHNVTPGQVERSFRFLQACLAERGLPSRGQK